MLYEKTLLPVSPELLTPPVVKIHNNRFERVHTASRTQVQHLALKSHTASPVLYSPEMMLKSVGAVMVTAAFLLCAGDSAAQQVDIGSQLKGLDVPEGLKEIIGSMMLEMRELKNETQTVKIELRQEKKAKQSLQSQIHALRKDVAEQCGLAQKRRAQEVEPEPEPEAAGAAEVVHIFKRSLSTTHLSGRVDESNGGHRLLTEEGADCSSEEISRQIYVINVECCDEPDEDCSGGKVQTCNAGCGALIMPLWTSCRVQLGSAAKVLQDAVTLCPPDIPVNSMDAQLFMVTCPAGLPANDCIPLCEAETHGFLLLLNIDGADTTLTCSLSDLLYSWVGAAALGGFLGRNVQAFVSAVISGAAGTYVLTLVEDADVGTDLVVQPGQNVTISGDVGLAEAPRWGVGGFSVGEMGSLSLSYVQLDADALITVTNGGSLSLVNLALPTAALIRAVGGLSGIDSMVTLEAVTVSEHLELGVLTGTAVATGVEGELPVLAPPDLQLPPFFHVISGPCTVADGGRCVGRWPGGYSNDEHCEISVTGASSGTLGPCSVYDLCNCGDHDYLTLPGGNTAPHCPAGTTLTSGQTLTWQSDHRWQGGDPCQDGTCLPGLPSLDHGFGGGWQVCFA
eukprot:SAG11_NODE_2913_length_2842_cov_109.057966_1_plen_623_part_00